MENLGDWPFLMNPIEIVHVAYRECLGREPDEAGLRYWTGAMIANKDPTIVFRGILDSREYRDRSPLECEWHQTAYAARLKLGRTPVIVDVGAQAFDGHVYAALTQYCSTEIIGFDPLSDRIAERQKSEGNNNLHLLPFAIGDGQDHVLHINNEDATSSIFPLNTKSNILFNHLSTLHTDRTEKISTVRLDEALERDLIDFLKIDVQGATLMVLQGARNLLARTAVIHCEVEFTPIYEGQPLAHETAAYLDELGFYLVDFATMKHYHYVDHGTVADHADRLIWADAVYFRQTDDPKTLAAQALIAASIYRKLSLARQLLAQI